MDDLWPDDITPEDDLRAPITILKEQASLLGKKTNNLVKGEVERDIEDYTSTRDYFIYNFFLVAPALEDYHYLLFDIVYHIPFYPVVIGHMDDDTLKEINYQKDWSKSELIAPSEEELIKMLGLIFKAKRTKFIIKSLISQSGGINPR